MTFEPWQRQRTEEVLALLKAGKITNGEALIAGLLLDVLAALKKLSAAPQETPTP